MKDTKPLVEEIAAREPRLFPEVLLAQFAVETYYGNDGPAFHNWAGISRNGRVLFYPNTADFIAAYVHVIRLPMYTHVLEAKTIGEQMKALGESPWAESHYALAGQPAGSMLEAAYREDLAPHFEADWGEAAPPLTADPEPGTDSNLTKNTTAIDADLENVKQELLAAQNALENAVSDLAALEKAIHE